MRSSVKICSQELVEILVLFFVRECFHLLYEIHVKEGEVSWSVGNPEIEVAYYLRLSFLVSDRDADQTGGLIVGHITKVNEALPDLI